MTADFGKGLDLVMRMESGKVSGLVNGIDTQLFDPQKDSYLPAHFSSEDLSGKVKNKAALQERLGLPQRADVPLIGIVSRLTDQKGFDLVVNELPHLLEMDIQLVVLGTGYAAYENAFSWFASQYPEKCSASIAFDLSLAQQIYAGSDLFLMPSAFEPCGLSQMMAMRYGSLPIVSEVGGLKDTVSPYNAIEQTGTGFSFNHLTGYWMTKTVEEALRLYREEPAIWRKLQVAAMTRDFSWDTACKAYLSLYNGLIT